jgi:hypothetical protein
MELRERIAQVVVNHWWCEDCQDIHEFVMDDDREKADAILASIQETHVVVEKDRFARMRGVVLGIQDVQEMQQAQGEDVDADVRAVMLRLQAGDLERLP